MIFVDEQDTLRAYRSLTTLPRAQALKVVDDLLETIDYVKGLGENGPFYKGKLAGRMREAQLELMQIRSGERDFVDLSPPPSETELLLMATENVRRNDYDAYMKNENLRSFERELLEDLQHEDAQRQAADAWVDAHPLAEEARLDEIAEVRKNDYDAYMKNDELRKEDLALRQQILGEDVDEQ